MIYIEPNKVDEYADQMESLGKQMNKKMSEVDDRVKSLRADWQDDVQTDYDARFSKLMALFQELAEVIPPYANDARAHAAAMRRIGKG